MSSKGQSGCRQDRKAQQNVKRLRIQKIFKRPSGGVSWFTGSCRKGQKMGWAELHGLRA